MRVALVSDTHGLVDPLLAPLFQGCERVLHAGDIVKPPVLGVLAAVAPVIAVRGNNDHDPAFWKLPETVVLELGGVKALMVHDLGDRAKPHPAVAKRIARERPQLVIHGHSHKPAAVRLDGTLYVNPGSAGPRRFSLPRTAAVLEVDGRRLTVRFFDLSGDAPRPFGAPVDESFD